MTAAEYLYEKFGKYISTNSMTDWCSKSYFPPSPPKEGKETKDEKKLLAALK